MSRIHAACGRTRGTSPSARADRRSAGALACCRAAPVDPACGARVRVRKATIAWLVSQVLLGAALAPAIASAQGVSAAIVPSSTSVPPGTEFDIYLQVTQAGSAFNAFDAVIGFDPAALTPVSISPLSLQRGTLMTSACGNTFHRFRQGTDRDTVTLVLLCNGVSVTGPGQLYRLRFRASSTPQVTMVRLLSGLRFYNAGVNVVPVTPSDASITIGSPVGVEDALLRPPGPRLRATPNPSRSAIALLIETPSEGSQGLVIHDVLGRVVRRFEAGWFPPGQRQLTWDGRGDSGEILPPGLYFARLVTPAGNTGIQIVRLR